MSNNTIVDERLAAVEKELEAEKKKTNGLAIELANEKRVSNALREDVEQQKRLKRMVDSKAKSDNTQLKKQVGELTASLNRKDAENDELKQSKEALTETFDEKCKKLFEVNGNLNKERARADEWEQKYDQLLLENEVDKAIEEEGGLEMAANHREFLRAYLKHLLQVFVKEFGLELRENMGLSLVRNLTKKALGPLAIRDGGVLKPMPRDKAIQFVNGIPDDSKRGLTKFFVSILDQNVYDITYEHFMSSSNELLTWYDKLNKLVHENRLTRENVNEGLAELKKRNVVFGGVAPGNDENVVTKQMGLLMKTHNAWSAPVQAPKQSPMKKQALQSLSTPQRRPAQRNSHSAPTPRSHYQHQTADVGHYGQSSGDRSRRAGQSSHFAIEAQSFSPQGSFPGQGQSQDHGTDFGYYGPSTGDAQSRYNSAPGYSAQGQDYGGRFTSRDRGHNARFQGNQAGHSSRRRQDSWSSPRGDGTLERMQPHA